MSRRVCIGQQGTPGVYGLRCAAPGFDALLSADTGDDITLDSSWSDIAKVHAIGIVPWSSAAWTQLDPFGNVLTFAGFAPTWPDLGYKPFTEARHMVSNVVYDDYWSSAAPMGNPANVLTNTLRISATSAVSSYQLIFIAYRIPVPSQ